MKTDDLGWGVRSDPPARNVLAEAKHRSLGVSEGVPQKQKMLRIAI